MKKYDLIVIGSGGGSKVSIPTVHKGKKVAIIEEDRIGGTCLNKGCIPSKMIIHPGNVAQMIRDSAKFDIKAKISSINLPKIIKRVTNTVFEESDGLASRYKKQKDFDFYNGHAKFIQDKVVKVNGKELTAKTILIATGARPRQLNIEGLQGTPYWTSTEALRSTKKIKSLTVIGGGFIACELGHSYSSLGVKTEFLVRSGLIESADKDIKDQFLTEFSKNQKVHLHTNTKKVEYKNKKFTVHFEQEGKTKKITSDALLVAAGVVPNADNLGLENTKIKLSKQGFIQVDKHLQTSVKGVYAIGDVVGNYMFRHSVNFEGEYLFDQLYGKAKKAPIKYSPVPYAVFTYPEVAAVGVTEDELISKGKKEGKDYVIGLNNYKNSAMGMARLSDHGFVKLIFDKKSQKLIGAHIIGEEASTMIHQLIYAITFNAKIDDLLKMIYIHPALPEIVRNAVRKAKNMI